MGAFALLLVGSYLFAIAFTGITLLPLTVVAVGLSGSSNIPRDSQILHSTTLNSPTLNSPTLKAFGADH